LLSLLFAVVVLGSSCAEARDQPEYPSFDEPDTLFARRIPIDADLRLRDGFDYSVYAGIIESADSLRRLWSHVVNVQREVYGRRDADVHDPPDVDFARNMILWFGHRGVGASFVDSLQLSTAAGSDSLIAIVHVFHSDFGSRGFDMWELPRTTRTVVFETQHKYETRAP
jgi:hypothetical protein